MDRAQKEDDIGKRNPLMAKAPHFAKGPSERPEGNFANASVKEALTVRLDPLTRNS